MTLRLTRPMAASAPSGAPHSETELPDATAQLRFQLAALNAVANAVLVTDREGRITWVNPAFTRLTGYTLEEVEGHTPSVLKSGRQDDACYRQLWRTILAGDVWQGELVNRRKDGSLYPEEMTITPVRDEAGEIVRFIAIKQDVTERKRAQAEVLAINARLRTVLADLSEREATIRQQAERLQLLNEFARMVSSTLDPQSVFAIVVRQVQAMLQGEWCVVAQHDPVARQFHIVASAGDGDSTAFQVSGTLSEQSASGEALRSRAAHVVGDLLGGDASPDRQESQAPGHGSMVSLPILVGQQAWGVLNVGFATPGQVTPDVVAFLGAITTHLATAIHNAELYTTLRTTHDVLQRTQEQIVQQERLRALGEMASGIAHDFNNALAPIVGFSELLLDNHDRLRDKQKTITYLQLIHAGATDAAAVVRRLREFYRAREAGDERAQFDLAAVVRRAIALTQPKWRDQALAGGVTIAVESDLAPLPPFVGDAAGLREVLANLIFNAVDAMPEGGTITIRVCQSEVRGPKSSPPPDFGPRTATPRTCGVALEVADTGVGMTEEVRRRCVEPFFTTKGERGTGLGLSVVHGIVQRHGGTMEVNSTPGQGTTFRLWLPLGRGDLHADRDGDGDEAPAGVQRALRVLVADDEPLLRDVLASLLAEDGHTVQTVADGREALARFQKGRFDLVVTDRSMPELNGDRLAAALKHVAPGLPVIMLTGFGDLMSATGDRPAGVDLVLPKPVTREALRRAVAQAVP